MKIFLLGFYGYDNLGDEVLLASILDALRADYNQFKVLSYNAKKTAQTHAVTAVSRRKNIGVIREIADSDVIIVGGGSILQDITSSKSFFYYIGILFTGKLLGKRVYLLGNGFGPVNRGFNRRFLKWFIPRIDGVVARDDASYRAYQEYGCRRLFSGVDCAFGYRSGQLKVPNEPPYVVISLRPWRNSKALRELIKAYIPQLNQMGYGVKLLAMKQPDDALEMQSLCQVGDNTQLLTHDIATTMAALKGAKFLIGMRLHALILAAVVGTPFVALSYDPKIDGFVKQLKLAPALPVAAIERSDLDDAIRQLLADYDCRRRRLAAAVADNRRLAQRQIEVIKEWMEQYGRTG